MENYEGYERITKDDLEDLKIEIKRNKPKLGSIKFLLLLSIIALGYLSVNTYFQTNYLDNIDSNRQVLVVAIESSDSKLSDKDQFIDGLDNGGMIIISKSGDYLDRITEYKFQNYGALDSSNRFYPLGAILNYIASKGWMLVQNSSPVLQGDYYYFVK